MFSFASIFNAASHFHGFANFEDAEYAAWLWATTNFTAVDVFDAEGHALLRVCSSGRLIHF